MFVGGSDKEKEVSFPTELDVDGMALSFKINGTDVPGGFARVLFGFLMTVFDSWSLRGDETSSSDELDCSILLCGTVGLCLASVSLPDSRRA